MFRWYKKTDYSWYWDSRNDTWYKSGLDSEYVLQYFQNNKWHTVPKVHEEITPPKPKN